MAEQDDWSVSSSEAVNISLVVPGESSPRPISSFHPQFTYPIFGTEEVIAGYQGLRIDLRFAAHDLRPNLAIYFDKKHKSTGDSQPTDIEGELGPFLAEESFVKPSEFDDRLQNDLEAQNFSPPGKRVESYASKGRNFEIWSGELSDPRVKLLISRMQIFVSFFIEGGTPLDLDEEEWSLSRWRIYFVYEKIAPPTNTASSYSLVGYASSYRFINEFMSKSPSVVSTKPTLSFTLPPEKPLHASNLPSRIRISQFLILPIHHSHGHGSHLYEAMVKAMLASSTCSEITVEDPSEAFDDLRDYRDYARLSENGTFSKVNFDTTIDPKLAANKIGVRVPRSALLDTKLLEALRNENKIAPRQFYRLVEMYLFSRISPLARQAGTARLTQKARSKNADDRAFYYWRLIVKQRVYKQHRDKLIQLERLERVEKVEQTVGDIAGDYERLLRGMQQWQDAEQEGAATTSNGHPGPSQARSERAAMKRKILDEDDEEQMETGTPKRARSEALE